VIATSCVRSWHEREQEYVLATLNKNPNADAKLQRAMTESVDKFKKNITPPMRVFYFVRSFMSPLTTEKLVAAQRYFVKNRNIRSSSFNFPNYVLSCMEEDFVNVVGVSTAMWLIAIVYVFLQGPWAEGALLIFTVACFVTVCSMSYKLRTILTKVVEAQKTGTFLGDDCFWFGKPKVMLQMLRMTMFMNSFQLACNVFYAWKFPITHYRSCFYHMMPKSATVVMCVMCVATFMETAFVLLPLYSLAVNLGENFNPAVFSDLSRKLILSSFSKKSFSFASQDDAATFIQKKWREKQAKRTAVSVQKALMNDGAATAEGDNKV